MLKLKWFSIFRLCCLILFSLFDFPCLLPLEQCIVMCNIFHGEVNQLIDVSTSYFHFLLLLLYFLLCLLRFECASCWLEMATLKHLLTGCQTATVGLSCPSTSVKSKTIRSQLQPLQIHSTSGSRENMFMTNCR